MTQIIQVIALVALGAIALAVVVGAIVLAAGEHTVPGELWTIGGTAVGGLGGALTLGRTN